MTTLAPPPPRPAVAALDVVVSQPDVPARPPLPARVRRVANLLTVGLVFVALGVPLFGFCFREQPPLDENRAPHPFPPLALKRHVLQDFPQWFSMYFRDRVGYRDVLLGWHRHATVRWFDVPVTDQAWLGKDGWVFLNVADPFARRTDKGTVNDRIDEWCEAFADRRAYLASRGIAYVVVLIPEKSSMYPELLTGQPKRHPPPEPLARAEWQLRKAGVPCANLMPALVAAKARGGEPLYFATDSHWTPAGGRVGYDALCQTLAEQLPGFRPLPATDFQRPEKLHPGDLLRLTGDTDREPEPFRAFLPPPGTVSVQDAPPFLATLPESMKLRHIPPVAFDNPTATGPGVVLLRDSFGDQLLPFLGADFRRVAVIGTPQLPLAVLDAERPKLVIQQMVGRFLYSSCPGDDPAVSGFRHRK